MKTHTIDFREFCAPARTHPAPVRNDLRLNDVTIGVVYGVIAITSLAGFTAAVAEKLAVMSDREDLAQLIVIVMRIIMLVTTVAGLGALIWRNPLY